MYELVGNRTAKGMPVWHKAGDGPEKCWIYTGLNGNWFIGGEKAEAVDFQCKRGYIASKDRHGGLFPSKMNQWQWRDAPTKCVRVDPDISVSVETQDSSDDASTTHTLWRYVPRNGCPIHITSEPERRGDFTGAVLHLNDVFEVSEERMIDGICYLRFTDGSGWIEDKTPWGNILCERASTSFPAGGKKNERGSGSGSGSGSSSK